MAIGTLTLNNSGSTSDAPTYLINLTAAGLGTYATGGVAVKAAIETKLVRGLDIVAITGRGAGYCVGEYDVANDLLKIYDAASGAEVANAVDLSAAPFQLLVWGK